MLEDEPASWELLARSWERTDVESRAPGGSPSCSLDVGISCDAKVVSRGAGMSQEHFLEFLLAIRIDTAPIYAFLRTPEARDRAIQNAMNARADREHRELMEAASQRGRSWSGSWGVPGEPMGYETSANGDTIIVEGVAILRRTRGDSTLIVLADRRPGVSDSARVIVLRQRVTVPTHLTSHAWTVGDSSFFLFARGFDRRFRDELVRQVPLIGEWIK